MKYLCGLLLASAVLFAADASASRSTDIEVAAPVPACDLTKYQRAVLDMKWNQLAMRHFMAGMDSPNDAAQIAQVYREVEVGISALRREFGTDCVLDIL